MTRTGWQKTWVRILTTSMTIAMMVLIFCFSMEDAEQSDRTSGFISDAVISVFYPDYREMNADRQQEVYDSVQFIVRKCAHLLEYLTLGFLLRLCAESWAGHRTGNRRFLLAAAFLIGAAYAGTDELHQLAIDGRSGQWADVLVDSCGVLAGSLSGTLMINRRTGRKQHRGKRPWQ